MTLWRLYSSAKEFVTIRLMKNKKTRLLKNVKKMLTLMGKLTKQL